MELAMSRVVNELVRRGLRHSVACLKGDPFIQDRFDGSVAIHCLRARPNEWRLPGRLLALIRHLRPTVIHARNWGAWPDVAVARLATRPRVPLIFSFHGFGRSGRMPLRRRLAFRILARMTTCLFTLSEESRRVLVREYGWPSRCDVIPNGVDTDRFRPAASGPRRGPLVVGTVGNLRAVKNHALLMRAGAELAATGLDVEVRIAGAGEEQARLLGLASSLGFADRLRLVGYQDDVPAFLQALDVFALTSDSEQHPNALAEAMASGLPCVATRVGGVAELLDDGRCGRIVEPGDVRALVAALGELARAPDLCLTLGAAARRRACGCYGMDRMVGRYEELYRRLSARETGDGR
jgi:glycosyltransferase involved in cell wall biosynthesis